MTIIRKTLDEVEPIGEAELAELKRRTDENDNDFSDIRNSTRSSGPTQQSGHP